MRALANLCGDHTYQRRRMRIHNNMCKDGPQSDIQRQLISSDFFCELIFSYKWRMYSIEFENATSPLTIDHFHQILYWPHMVAYLFYLIQKCLMFLALIGHFICEKRKGEFKLFQCFDLVGLTILCVTCCYACVCCCSCFCCPCRGRCCFNEDFDFEEEVTKPFISFLYKSRVNFDRWVVKIILGKDEKIVSRVDDYVNDKVDKDGIPNLYIHGQRLTHIHIRALYILVFMFSLLTLGSAWGTFVFNITHICVDDHPNIYCFAVPSDYDTSLSISKERVTNCSHWSDLNGVEFTCFQFAYNMPDALATFGGLLALFQVAVTAGTSAILSLIEFILSCGQPSRDPGQRNEVNNPPIGYINIENGIQVVHKKVQCCKHWIKHIRYFISIIAAVTEIFVAVSVAVLLKSLDKPSVGVISAILLKHGSQILIVIAIIGTIPLLPLEEYVSLQAPSEPVAQAGQQGEGEDTSSTTCPNSKNENKALLKSLA